MDDNKDNEEVKKIRPNTFVVWNYFEKIGVAEGVKKCKCQSVGNSIPVKLLQVLMHHIPKCYLILKYHDVGALLDNKATFLKQWKFDNRAYRDALSRCIVKHDLPFS